MSLQELCLLEEGAEQVGRGSSSLHVLADVMRQNVVVHLHDGTTPRDDVTLADQQRLQVLELEVLPPARSTAKEMKLS